MTKIERDAIEKEDWQEDFGEGPWSLSAMAKGAGYRWAHQYVFPPLPETCPSGKVWHFSFYDGWWAGEPLPNGERRFVKTAPRGALCYAAIKAVEGDE